jgi:hypothetical protein
VRLAITYTRGPTQCPGCNRQQSISRPDIQAQS